MNATPQAVLEFWFSSEAEARWFSSTPSFDARVAQRFGSTARELARGPFPHPVWESGPEPALALIIMLDQFPRNMFRGTGKAYAWDDRALGVAGRTVDRGWDMEVEPSRRKFVYMPFMHAEDLAAQERCVALCRERLDDGGATLRFAREHRDIIARFGRFPHRNDELGRDTTAEEAAFLEAGGFNPD